VPSSPGRAGAPGGRSQAGAHPGTRLEAHEREKTVARHPAPNGGHITLRFEDDVPAGPPLPDSILASDPATAWSGLTILEMTPWDDHPERRAAPCCQG